MPASHPPTPPPPCFMLSLVLSYRGPASNFFSLLKMEIKYQPIFLVRATGTVQSPEMQLLTYLLAPSLSHNHGNVALIEPLGPMGHWQSLVAEKGSICLVISWRMCPNGTQRVKVRLLCFPGCVTSEHLLGVHARGADASSSPECREDSAR